MLEKAAAWMRSLTEAGIALIALGVVLQIIWPGSASVPFIGLDIVGSILGLVKTFGSEGLVGLIALWVLWGIYKRD
jgi:sulfite exporter TauE/SafE